MLEKQNLLGLPQSKLNKFFEDLGEKPYRTKQIMQWIYHQGASSFDEMHNLSKDLRSKLSAIATLDLPRIVKQNHASDGVIKWVIELSENNHIETVYIPEKERGTLCISSQVGCALACTFCSTGVQGFNRNLKSHEIIAQVLIAHHYLVAKDKRISNVVFMGMGEPLANFNAVTRAIRIINAPWGLGIGARKITVSTVGLPAAIERLAAFDVPVTLALSLHAPNDDLRKQLIPWAKFATIKEILSACDIYFKATGREITLEYLLLRGVNDRVSHAKELAELCKTLRCNVNLIRYNEVSELPFERPDTKQVHRFQETLSKANVNSHIRASRGRDIAAACGQLKREVSQITIEESS